MLAPIYCGLVISIFCVGKSLGISDEMVQMAKMLHDECVEESGVDEALITKCNSGEKLPDDGKLKCYMKCLMDQLSALTDDGEIDTEVLVSMLPEEIADEAAPIIRKCGTVKGADECDTVYQTQMCYWTENPTKYFLL